MLYSDVRLLLCNDVCAVRGGVFRNVRLRVVFVETARSQGSAVYNDSRREAAVHHRG